MHEEIDLEDLQGWLETGAQLVDVREEWEYVTGHLPGAVNVPMSELLGRLHEVPDNVVLVCQSGARSRDVAYYLTTNGYSKVANLTPGTLGWRLAGLELEVSAPDGEGRTDPSGEPSD